MIKFKLTPAYSFFYFFKKSQFDYKKSQFTYEKSQFDYKKSQFTYEKSQFDYKKNHRFCLKMLLF